MDSTSRVLFARTARRQQNMIHSACPQYGVVHADGYTRTQQRIKYSRLAAGGDFTDIKANLILMRKAGPDCFGPIAEDPELPVSTAMPWKVGVDLQESRHCFTSLKRYVV
jgi:hypothetical protein